MSISPGDSGGNQAAAGNKSETDQFGLVVIHKHWRGLVADAETPRRQPAPATLGRPPVIKTDDLFDRFLLFGATNEGDRPTFAIGDEYDCLIVNGLTALGD